MGPCKKFLIPSRDMRVKKKDGDKAKGMRTDKPDQRIYITENVSGQILLLNS